MQHLLQIWLVSEVNSAGDIISSKSWENYKTYEMNSHRNFDSLPNISWYVPLLMYLEELLRLRISFEDTEEQIPQYGESIFSHKSEFWEFYFSDKFYTNLNRLNKSSLDTEYLWI